MGRFRGSLGSGTVVELEARLLTTLCDHKMTGSLCDGSSEGPAAGSFQRRHFTVGRRCWVGTLWFPSLQPKRPVLQKEGWLHFHMKQIVWSENASLYRIQEMGTCPRDMMFVWDSFCVTWQNRPRKQRALELRPWCGCCQGNVHITPVILGPSFGGAQSFPFWTPVTDIYIS